MERDIARRGHFAYESGEHGDLWLDLAAWFADPQRLHRAAERLADALRPYAPDVVCGPLIGGAFVGQAVALALGTGFAYAEARPGAAGMVAYAVPPGLRPTLRGRRVAVVDDAINAGAATLATAREVAAWGGGVVVVGALLIRVPGGVERLVNNGFAVEALEGVAWNLWPEAACPLCQAGLPLAVTTG